ncbi:hypothetical protein V8C43DRAFT_285539 [Trichoderma afarasin]|uniref:Kinetochore protein mis14 n=6 Tax=Trichoderma TaxID=5543 RepID=A0A2T4AFC4_TRIHA|nr:hypothetical protein M431DRAFT_494058 [Trichoderma harzianum CBS 226.95]XP_056031087.1 kinetochore protein mis14 like domain-containing protein [Trichoderma breve]KAF3068225.1 hypothetical protein CFAM422_008284 [Trichoderma lentiforme]KAK0764800.1 hypothetical protein N5P37_002269 [Trichoderma harzianum]OPB36751.1 hypothetical protein A0O28_0058310 [Trichoderma guizhouense]QYS96184.1 hypothetical protein H0G86_003445 [Trichoderma simmonsii]KAJ4862031.1 kinetochore protein mis14 like domai
MDSESVVSQVQRKIELQSPEDLAYLITNVRNAAVEHLNEAFPPVEGAEEDELRIQIELLVNEYINKTFSLAAPNLIINGLPVSPDVLRGSASTPDTVYEPFDTRKRRQVADLITQEEKLLEDVAALKRSVPAKVAADHAERVRAAMRQDDDDLHDRVARDAAAAQREAGSLGVAQLQRQEGVEAGFKSAVQGLNRLKRDMPAVVAKMERARVAGEYVVTKGR